MAVFKIEKNKNYTVMSNYHLRDKRMSLKAKGLLSFMLSLPLDWDYSLDGLEKICKEGKESIRSALNELKLYGYLVIKKTQNNKGIFEYEYMIYEYPYSENPDDDNLTATLKIKKTDKTGLGQTQEPICKTAK